MSTLREQFEAWHKKKYNWMDSVTYEKTDEYDSILTQGRWEAWQAATEAAKATSAVVGKLPPLAKRMQDELDTDEGNLDYRHGYMAATSDAVALVALAEAARQPAPVDDITQRKAAAFDEWIEKTDWVQEQSSAFPIKALGMHRADVMREEIERLRAALAATAAPVRNEADERDNEIFELQKALAFWLPQVNQFMSDEMSQRIAHDAYMLVIDGNLPDDFKTAQELGWILPATGKVQRDAEMVCGNCMEPIPTTVMDTPSMSAPAAALSDESIDELAKPLMEQCVIVYGDMRRFARAIIAATRSQP